MMDETGVAAGLVADAGSKTEYSSQLGVVVPGEFGKLASRKTSHVCCRSASPRNAEVPCFFLAGMTAQTLTGAALR